MVACIVLVIFNGIPPFLGDPFDVRMFIASYIGVSFSRSDKSS
jgi:amino acid transporter